MDFTLKAGLRWSDGDPLDTDEPLNLARSIAQMRLKYAVITSVDLDHVEYLGPDRESIGYEKAAAIAKLKAPVWSS